MQFDFFLFSFFSISIIRGLTLMVYVIKNLTGRMINFGVHAGNHIFFTANETKELSDAVVHSIGEKLETYFDSRMFQLVEKKLPVIADTVTESSKRRVVKA